MKKNYVLLLLLLNVVAIHAQNIVFIDMNLKAKLVSVTPENFLAQNSTDAYVAIDTNHDNEISVAEALLIHRLDVSGAAISNLQGLEQFTNLRNVNCHNNNLTSVNNLATLPYLDNLYCSSNPLHTLDATIFPHLTYLLCEGAQLTSLNISGMTYLHAVYCGGNPFTTINLTGLPNLMVFHCSASNLVHLDVSQLYSLYNLFVYTSPFLETVNMKNGSIESENGVNFEGCPLLQYVCCDESQITNIKSVVDMFGNTECVVNSYCSFAPGGVSYTLQGQNRIDMQGDGCNAADIVYPYMKFSIAGNQAGVLISNQNGSYSIPVSAGTHTLTPFLENPGYFNVSPSNAAVSFPSQASPAVRDFCIVPNGTHPDLEVVIIPISGARPGFDARYKLVCRNKGNTTASGVLTFVYNDAISDFVYAIPATDTQSTNNLVWNFSNLQPFQSIEFEVKLNINSPVETPAVNLGDVLEYTATVNASITDDTPLDNTITIHEEVVNAIDPNDKTCLEGNVIAPSDAGKYVHYLIRFENTGTASAENVVVKDIIALNKFDINSLFVLSSSHNCETRIGGGGKVEFIFQNINLPFDDASNDGYIAFKIKTRSTLVVGDTFSNSASIYFDYNAPIVTEPAVTAIALLQTQDFEFTSEFALYPNPANALLNIQSKNQAKINSIDIYNTLGQLVLAVTNAETASKIDVSDLASGNYFVRVGSDKGNSNVKFIKQ